MPRGSKPGERRGGRQAGVPNKKNAEKIAAIEASGITPLDFLLDVMRSANHDYAARIDAAKAAAPYVHPRLASVDLGNKDGKAFEHKVYGWADDPSQAIPDPSREG